jgi:hypothetical protein
VLAQQTRKGAGRGDGLCLIGTLWDGASRFGLSLIIRLFPQLHLLLKAAGAVCPIWADICGGWPRAPLARGGRADIRRPGRGLLREARDNPRLRQADRFLPLRFFGNSADERRDRDTLRGLARHHADRAASVRRARAHAFGGAVARANGDRPPARRTA